MFEVDFHIVMIVEEKVNNAVLKKRIHTLGEKNRNTSSAANTLVLLRTSRAGLVLKLPEALLTCRRAGGAVEVVLVVKGGDQNSTKSLFKGLFLVSKLYGGL